MKIQKENWILVCEFCSLLPGTLGEKKYYTDFRPIGVLTACCRKNEQHSRPFFPVKNIDKCCDSTAEAVCCKLFQLLTIYRRLGRGTCYLLLISKTWKTSFFSSSQLPWKYLDITYHMFDLWFMRIRKLIGKQQFIRWTKIAISCFLNLFFRL